MSRILFYDTETSGMPLWDQPSDDPRQPHIAQIAAALVDTETRRDLAAINLTVKPDEWSCDPESQAVHGITPEIMEAIGIPEVSALKTFCWLWSKADVRVGHVESFDARIIRIAMKRFDFVEAAADAWRVFPAMCTRKLAKDHVPNLKPKGMGSLRQVHLHYTGHEFADAHSAEADMRATQRVYFAMLEKGHV